MADFEVAKTAEKHFSGRPKVRSNYVCANIYQWELKAEMLLCGMKVLKFVLGFFLLTKCNFMLLVIQNGSERAHQNGLSKSNVNFYYSFWTFFPSILNKPKFTRLSSTF